MVSGNMLILGYDKMTFTIVAGFVPVINMNVVVQAAW